MNGDDYMNDEISFLEELFLSELTELSKKYNIYIDGCGCCNSPYLTYEEPTEEQGDLSWDRENKEYRSC